MSNLNSQNLIHSELRPGEVQKERNESNNELVQPTLLQSSQYVDNRKSKRETFSTRLSTQLLNGLPNQVPVWPFW